MIVISEVCCDRNVIQNQPFLEQLYWRKWIIPIKNPQRPLLVEWQAIAVLEKFRKFPGKHPQRKHSLYLS